MSWFPAGKAGDSRLIKCWSCPPPFLVRVSFRWSAKNRRRKVDRIAVAPSRRRNRGQTGTEIRSSPPAARPPRAARRLCCRRVSVWSSSCKVASMLPPPVPTNWATGGRTSTKDRAFRPAVVPGAVSGESRIRTYNLQVHKPDALPLSYLAIPAVVSKLLTRDTAGRFSGPTRRQRRRLGSANHNLMNAGLAAI